MSRSGRATRAAAERIRPSSRGLAAGLALAAALACTALPCHAVEEESDLQAALDPDYAAGRKAYEAKNWNAAIKFFSSAALRAPENADIQNYLGYAYRKAGKLDLAFKHYKRALELNPRHRGAHEYLGEAYLMIGNVHKAEEHLSALKGICLLPCREYGQLEKKLAEYRSR